MKTLLLHHHDLDGYAAGDIAMMAFPQAEPRSMNYDDPSKFPTPADFAEYDTVIVVDYSLPPETMLWLKENRRLLWIDHHVSAIRISQERGFDDAEGLRCQPGELVCGAELAWAFFQSSPLPRFLKLVGDYDTFRNSKSAEFQEEVLPFFYATQIHFPQMNPANFHQADFLLGTPERFQDEEWCRELVREGRLIQDFNRQYYSGILKESAFVREIWGMRILCFNSAGHGSVNMVQAFDPEKHDAMLLYSYNGKRWSYGLYSDGDAKPQVDCAAIARRYGGGGHRSAAGFSCLELLPELGR